MNTRAAGLNQKPVRDGLLDARTQHVLYALAGLPEPRCDGPFPHHKLLDYLIDVEVVRGSTMPN